MGGRRIIIISAVTALLIAGCGGDGGGADEEALAELQEQLDTAEQRADDAEAENERLAEQLAELEESASDTTTAETTPEVPDPPVTDPPATDSPVVTEPPPTTEPPPPPPPPDGGIAAPNASPLVAVFGDIGGVPFPEGEPGTVSVIAYSPVIDSSGSVPVIVRNRTNATLGTIDVSGIARDGAGTLIASGSSQGLEPAVVGAGEIAFGYVYFEYALADTVPASLEFTIDAEPPSNFFTGVPITELSVTDDGLVGIVTNDSAGDVGGPISVLVMCFDAAGTPSATSSSYVEQDELAPGAPGSFSISFYSDAELCRRGLVGSSGYGF